MASGACFLILNYSSASDTAELVKHIRGLELSFDHQFVVVDNYSSESEADRLGALLFGQADVKVIYVKDNLGYAKGNNVGLRFISDNLPEHTVVYICNSDIAFTDSAVIEALYARVISGRSNFCSSLMKVGQDIKPHRVRVNTLFADVISLYPFSILRKLVESVWVGGFVRYEESFGDVWREVEALNGSFFCGKIRDFGSVGLFDEATFLYCEERIFAERCKKQNFNAAILSSDFYLHKEGGVTKGRFSSPGRLVELCRSRLVFYRYYRRGWVRIMGQVFHFLAMKIYNWVQAFVK